MNPDSVWWSLVVSLVVFVVLLVAYTCLALNPANAGVYYLKDAVINKRIHTVVTDEPFEWIRLAYCIDDKYIVDNYGLDSAVYFIFYKTVLKIFLSGMVLAPLLPILAAANTSTKSSNGMSSGTFNYISKWSIAHIEENSLILYALVAATYWVSFFTVHLLGKTYDRVSNLRADALMSRQMKPEDFAVLVRDIPSPSKGQSRKEQVDAYFKELHPDSYYGALVFTNYEEVDSIWRKLERCKKKLAQAKKINAKSDGKNFERSGATTKTGLFGLIGPEVDSIKYYDDKVKELESILKTEQTIALNANQQPSALVFFTKRVAAIASQGLINRKVVEWTVTHAPDARELLRSDLHMDFTSRQSNKDANCYLLVIYLISNLCLMVLISVYSSLDNMMELFPSWDSPVVDTYARKVIVEAFLPQITLVAFTSILPKFLRITLDSEGIPSLSCLERAVAGKCFLFTVLNVIVGFTVFNTFLDSWKKIKKSPDVIVSLLASSLPATATFFMTFVALKSSVVFGLELSRLVPLAIFHLKKKYLCKTKADAIELIAPVSLGYETRLPGDMLVFAVVLCYSIISPTILPMGVLYFSIGWLVLRNQVIRVYVPAYESYGRMWPHINNRILASLVLFQVIMIGYLGLKQFYGCLLIVPLLIKTLRSAWCFEVRYSRFFELSSLTCCEVMNTKNMEKIVSSFIPPSMLHVEGLADGVIYKDVMDKKNAKKVVQSSTSPSVKSAKGLADEGLSSSVGGKHP